MRHRVQRRRVWKLTDLWTQRTRPQILAKPQNGFAQAHTPHRRFPFQKNQDQNLSESVVSYPQILRRRRKTSHPRVRTYKPISPEVPMAGDLKLCERPGWINTGVVLRVAQAFHTVERSAILSKKHGIDFADAATVLYDERAITIRDDDEDESLLMLSRRVLIAVYTRRPTAQECARYQGTR